MKRRDVLIGMSTAFGAHAFFSRDFPDSEASAQGCSAPEQVSSVELAPTYRPVFAEARKVSGTRSRVELIVELRQEDLVGVKKLVLTQGTRGSSPPIIETVFLPPLGEGERRSRFFSFSDLPDYGQYFLFFRGEQDESVKRIEVTRTSGAGEFNVERLPSGIKRVFENMYGSLENDSVPVTTNFDHHAKHRMFAHHVRFRVNRLSFDGIGEFNFQIEAMHPDLSEEHFSSLFFVTDPAGRILGLKQRAYNSSFDVAQDLSRDFMGAMNVTLLSQEERESLELDIYGDEIAPLSEIPYVCVYCCDGFDCLARSILFLR